MRIFDKVMERAPAANFSKSGPSVRAVKRLLAEAFPFRWYLLAAFLCMGLVATTEPALVWTMKNLVDQGFSVTAGNSLALMLMGLVLVFALRGAAGFVSGYLMIWISSSMLIRLQGQVYDAVLDADPQIDDVPLGQAVNSVVAEGRNALELVERVLIKFFRSLFSVLALTITLFMVDAVLALGLMTFAIPFIWAVRSAGRHYELAANGYVASNSLLAERMEETLTHVDLVKQYRAGELEARRLDRIGDRVNTTYRRMVAIAGMMVPITQLIVACYLAMLYWFRPALSERLTDGAFVAMGTTLLLMMVPLRDLAEVNGAILRGVVAALTVFSSADLPRERRGSVTFSAQFAPRIEFTDVTLTYPGTPAQTLDRVNLYINPGETVGLTGRCGAGKTSILNLIAGLARPIGGRVLIDGVPINEFDIRTLRDKIAHVGQDTLLLDDTIAFNVCYGEPVPDPVRLWQALEDVQLSAFVQSLPERELTRIGNGGVQLSGGQRQLLAVARALYRNAVLVLLDEPTSALDGESEHALLMSLRQLAKGRTTVLISHRAATLALAQRVYLLERGRILPATGLTVADHIQVAANAPRHPAVLENL